MYTNKGNTLPSEKFNPPTQHEVWENGKFTGTYCYVYDGPSWRNKNKSRTAEEAKPTPAPKAKDVSFSSPRKDSWAGAGA